ncbi:hypothetical protein ACVIGB_008273 [Bradyrhizobium sp. USDA 4341]
MAKRARIRYVNKTDRKNPHERITHVGELTPTGRHRREASAVDIVRRHGDLLDEAIVRREFEGSICRCTG